MTKISISPIISYIIKFVRYLLWDEWKVRDGNTVSQIQILGLISRIQHLNK